MNEPKRYEVRSDNRGLFVFDVENDCALILDDVAAKLNELAERVSDLEVSAEIAEHSGGYGI
jgi:hypothetical protein